ncbi:hypothetical protein J4Q44_G00117110 [Coregonus suidteri]|uniref:Uncharacterized protein n=1 Tax=Coregonus suidteri TaxID=861788 RepID=A0AAN8LU67_9TELE
MSQATLPRFLPDCLEAFLSSEDPVRVELSQRAVEGLVRKNTSTASESRAVYRKVRKQHVNTFTKSNLLQQSSTTFSI